MSENRKFSADLGQSVPLVPRPTSEKLPSTRAVNGVPEARVVAPLSCQSPNAIEVALRVFSHFLLAPKGSSMV